MYVVLLLLLGIYLMKSRHSLDCFYGQWGIIRRIFNKLSVVAGDRDLLVLDGGQCLAAGGRDKDQDLNVLCNLLLRYFSKYLLDRILLDFVVGKNAIVETS